MVSIVPLKDYLRAQDCLRRQDRTGAVKALNDCLGSPDNSIVEQHLDMLLNHETIAGQGVLEILRVELNKRG